MKYPHGVRRSNSFASSRNQSYSNRGMTLEEDINLTNEYYLTMNLAVIHKKPTPVQIVNVNYPKRSAAVITEAYFQQASTTDYNGVYRGKYIDFEAKETRSTTSFPLANVHEHQVRHMKSVIKHGGISFMIIRFTNLQETYFYGANNLFQYWDDQQVGGRKSIPYDEIKSTGYFIPFKYQPRVPYLDILNKLYF